MSFSEEIPNFPKRRGGGGGGEVELKPGLTGWAQVNGGYDLKS